MLRRRASLPLLSLVPLLAGCPAPSPQGATDSAAPASGGPTSPAEAAWFIRAPGDGGIDFRHETGHRDRYYMPESACGGAALFDMDNDGDLDVYLVQAGSLLLPPELRPPNRLFENRGDGTFTDVSERSGTGDRGYGMGVACGDYDDDGDIDLFVANYGRNILYRNNGDGVFDDVTVAAGLANEGWSTCGVFFDYDADGDLDLYVCSYLFWTPENEIDCYNDMGSLDFCSPMSHNTPAPDQLYRNNGDGTFTDVSEAAGITTSLGTGLGVLAGDFNLDSRPDLFIANDAMKDQLWINQGDGTFINDALIAGCAVDNDGVAKAGMGVTTADLDDDGDLDLMVCNLGQEADSMYRNDGGFFTDVTASAGLGHVSRAFTRFGMAWHDFNHDGLPDLYQANGRVKRLVETFSEDPYAEPNLLFRGVGPLRFVEQFPRGGTAEPLHHNSRAAAFGDIDNDGDIDILINNIDGPPYLLLNIAPKAGHWLLVRAVNDYGSDALGATVLIRLGDRVIRREVRPAYSYLASNDPRVHFGLGDRDRIDEVIITWPDGAAESFGPLRADQIIELRRGAGKPGPP